MASPLALGQTRPRLVPSPIGLERLRTRHTNALIVRLSALSYGERERVVRVLNTTDNATRHTFAKLMLALVFACHTELYRRRDVTKVLRRWEAHSSKTSLESRLTRHYLGDCVGSGLS